MRISLYIALLSLLFLTCDTKVKPASASAAEQTTPEINTHEIEFDDSYIDTLALGLRFTPDKTYAITKNEIFTKRAILLKAYQKETNLIKKQVILDQARVFFTNKLLNGLVPHWYGTLWDFNGYTNTPNDGVIACGYFVSTTLKHMGLKLNRYKLAQQGGLNEAKSLQPNQNLIIHYINNTHTFEDILAGLKKQLKDGLYFVGLSNHVGYLYVKDSELYFLNSDYAKGYVVIDKARHSPVFKSDIYVVANVTHNDFLIRSWLTQSVVTVVK